MSCVRPGCPHPALYPTGHCSLTCQTARTAYVSPNTARAQVAPSVSSYTPAPVSRPTPAPAPATLTCAVSGCTWNARPGSPYCSLTCARQAGAVATPPATTPASVNTQSRVVSRPCARVGCPWTTQGQDPYCVGCSYAQTPAPQSTATQPCSYYSSPPGRMCVTPGCPRQAAQGHPYCGQYCAQANRISAQTPCATLGCRSAARPGYAHCGQTCALTPNGLVASSTRICVRQGCPWPARGMHAYCGLTCARLDGHPV